MDTQKKTDIYPEVEIEKKWQELPPSDDFIFSKLMRNPEICKEALEVLLGMKIDHIEYPEEQKTIRVDVDAKSVRLDVYVEDEKDKVYNIEMQTVPQKYLAKRSRYYQGMVDLNLIERGAVYDELKTSFVIFICTFDPFSKGDCVYRFETVCRKHPELSLDDDAYKYFFNTKGTENVSDELRQLLNIFDNIFPESKETILTRKIRRELQRIKSAKEWRVEYMNLYMRDKEKYQTGYDEGLAIGKQQGVELGKQQGIELGKQQGVELGKQQGIELGKKESAIRMYRKGLEIAFISETLGISIDTVKEWIRDAK